MIVTWLGDTGLFINAAQKTVLIDPSFETEDQLGRVRFPPLPFSHPSMLPPADVVVLTKHGSEAALQKIRHRTVMKSGSQAFGAVSVSIHDGAVVIEGDGVRLAHVTGLTDHLGAIDLAFLPFEGSSPQHGLDSFVATLDRLKPQEAAPFGSGWSWVDDADRNFANRFTRQQLLGKALEPAHRLGVHLLMLDPGDQWSPDTGAIAKGLSDPWTDDPESVRRYAAQRLG